MSDTAGGTGCGISVTGHITGRECCLHCSCVCPYENAKKRTEHREVNYFILTIPLDVLICVCIFYLERVQTVFELEEVYDQPK